MGAIEPSGWLLRDGVVLASLEVARTRRARRRGLLGRDTVDGALLIPRCRQVHTIGMRVTIDVAFCDRSGRVLRIATVPPGRITRPCLRATQVVEAGAGSFAGWGIEPGDVLEFQ
jgi:hypothetical protein